MKKGSIFALLLVLALLLSACSTSSDKGKSITLTELQKALESYEVELDTVESGKSVTQFTITASKVNADKLMDRSYVKEAYELFMIDPGKTTYGQYQVLSGFGPVMEILGMIDTTPSGSFSTEAFVDEILDVICDGKTHSEAGWTITVKVDAQNSTLTITGTCQ